MIIRFQKFPTIVCLKLVRKKKLFCKKWGGLETIFDV